MFETVCEPVFRLKADQYASRFAMASGDDLLRLGLRRHRDWSFLISERRISFIPDLRTVHAMTWPRFGRDCQDLDGRAGNVNTPATREC
jgi:hypothetical protein